MTLLSFSVDAAELWAINLQFASSITNMQSKHFHRYMASPWIFKQFLWGSFCLEARCDVAPDFEHHRRCSSEGQKSLFRWVQTRSVRQKPWGLIGCRYTSTIQYSTVRLDRGHIPMFLLQSEMILQLLLLPSGAWRWPAAVCTCPGSEERPGLPERCRRPRRAETRRPAGPGGSAGPSAGPWRWPPPAWRRWSVRLETQLRGELCTCQM